MTSTERRELVERLHREANALSLTIIKREQTRGKWVWDVDTHGGTPVVRGMNLSELAYYLKLDRLRLLA
jgi:hypothetical protein